MAKSIDDKTTGRYSILLIEHDNKGTIIASRPLYVLDDDDDLRALDEAVESIGERKKKTNAREIIVMSVNPGATDNPPGVVENDVFPSMTAAAKMLGVSQSYLSQAFRDPNVDLYPWPCVVVRGVTLAKLEDTNYGD